MTARQHSHAAESQADPVIGTWSPEWSMGDGAPTPEDDLHDITLTFVDGCCKVCRGGNVIRLGTYANDRTNSPKTIDVHFTESDVPELIGATLRGIYEVGVEQLRICYGPPEGERATTFSGEKGTGQYLAEYRRK